jgi:hypothetical protein
MDRHAVPESLAQGHELVYVVTHKLKIPKVS